jgi:ribonuclease VapC
MMPEAVLDASALLALIHREPGSEVVRALVKGAWMSSVNWAEVAQKSIARGRSLPSLKEDLEAFGLEIVPFTSEQADIAASLWEPTHHLGFSFGDRACLATAISMSARAITADRIWGDLDVGIQVQVVR